MSSTYRVTVMVTTDVESDNEEEAMSSAISKVYSLFDDDPSKVCWITGIASDKGGYYVFKQVK